MIRDGFIVTMNPKNEVISKGSLLIEGNRILDVGKSSYISKKYTADIEIDASGKAVIPGLINSHTHLFQTMMKGIVSDEALWEWGNKVYAVLPLLSQEDLYQGVLNGCVEMIRSGTTCCIDNEKHGDPAIKAYKLSGIRGLLAKAFSNTIPDFYPKDKKKKMELSLESKEEILRDLERLIRTYHNSENGRIRVMPAPSMLYICTEDAIKGAKELAHKYKTGFTTHLNETKGEAEYCVKKHGIQEIEYAHKLGLLDRDMVAAHCVWTSEREIEILAKTGSTCSHNPESNMYLGDGIAPIPEMMNKRVNVALGTDGPASNNNLDMFEAMRFAALLHKVHRLDPTVVKALDVLKMATINGARAINSGDKLGSLEKGKLADVVLVNLKRPNTTPIYNVVSNLVYCATGDNVDTVIVDGKLLLKNGKFTDLNEKEVLEKTQKIAERIQNDTS
jgi:5-methylthioadenosine/S-adenosylhomocysteine deaminase